MVFFSTCLLSKIGNYSIIMYVRVCFSLFLLDQYGVPQKYIEIADTVKHKTSTHKKHK